MKSLPNRLSAQNDLVELLLKDQSRKFEKQLNKNSWDAMLFAGGALIYAICFTLPFYAFHPLFQ